ncbi:MAG: pyrroline-5-carboxylate reductase dimerization domain-containing protein [Collinsella sp.]
MGTDLPASRISRRCPTRRFRWARASSPARRPPRLTASSDRGARSAWKARRWSSLDSFCCLWRHRGGCAPAFVAMAIEALGDAAVKHGIPRADAYRIVSQMVLGTAKLQLATGQHPAAMKDAVCSPGGATIKGVVALEDAGMRSALVKAIDATLQ